MIAFQNSCFLSLRIFIIVWLEYRLEQLNEAMLNYWYESDILIRLDGSEKSNYEPKVPEPFDIESSEDEAKKEMQKKIEMLTNEK